MTFYQLLVHSHSVLRWFVLFAALAAIFMSFNTKAPFTKKNNREGVLFLTFLHLQFLLGLVIYFMSPWFQALMENGAEVMKDSTMRFYAIEHITMMLIAVIVATIGRAKVKRAATDEAKHRKTLIFVGIALLIIFIAIPWPFRFSNAGWF